MGGVCRITQSARSLWESPTHEIDLLFIYLFDSKLIQFQAQLQESTPFRKGTPMHDTTFDSISLRINSPYRVLHHGDCEHYFTIDQIRFVLFPFFMIVVVNSFIAPSYRIQFASPIRPSFRIPAHAPRNTRQPCALSHLSQVTSDIGYFRRRSYRRTRLSRVRCVLEGSRATEERERRGSCCCSSCWR